jgi:hypothetical protein
MDTEPADLNIIASVLDKFRASSFRETISSIEEQCTQCSADKVGRNLGQHGVTEALLLAALLMKWHSRQINEIVHATGVLLALPHILEPDEYVESVSLAAGNTGRGFDLCTNHRIAEFTFINWQGGPEVIRQNKIFKDFFFLAENETSKRKELYTIGTDLPRKFFESGRDIDGILKGNRKLGNEFRTKFSDRYTTVRDYYNDRKDRVILRDVSEVVPLFRTKLAGVVLS